MENLNYARISTAEQNAERQTVNGYKSFIDTCSGTISFFDRPKAKELMKYLKKNPSSIVNVFAVDRLGRNLKDILTTLEFFEENNYKLKIENVGMDSNSPFFKMVVSIIGTLAEQERKTIAERCKQGIELAKAKGLYQGRKVGTKDSRDKILEKHSDIVKLLNYKAKISEIAKITGKTRVTVNKVKELL
jgi:DNA invertase Pin-like site-specific DNA recombinase